MCVCVWTHTHTDARTQAHTHTVAYSRKPASTVLSQGALWGPGEGGEVFGKQKAPGQPVKWTLAFLAPAFPVGFIWLVGWGIVVGALPRSACLG